MDLRVTKKNIPQKEKSSMEQMKYVVTTGKILNDLEALTEGIFEAESVREEDALLLTFTNGQVFRIRVECVPAVPCSS